ncbi:MAG: diversity-generating retroelement protein Avd [Anaerolineae bacterium]|nr:diversity-generating retroelement protein Avd [Anaerolineae bacterium]
MNDPKRKESPIFGRTHDFIMWLLPHTMNFPRSQRFVLTRRLQDAALDFQERIIEAALNRGAQQAQHLHQADLTLAKVRYYLRLSHELGWLKPGQYAHASRMVTEIGKLLGGWRNPKPQTAKTAG